MRIKTVMINVALVGIMVVIGFLVLGQDSGSATPDKGGSNISQTAGSPEEKSLTLTVPEMSRVENDSVPTASGSNEQALKNHAAIHLKGTGFPWQEEANVYMAGHRMGYPSTESFLTFYDLNKLEKGDKVFVTDAGGTKYTYRVFKESVVSPNELSVTEPIEGKNILTLQTCTLPDYSKRLIVQAELVEKSSA